MNMDISNELAQDIVTDMKDIIHQDINYINTDGMIIASTDPSRIGSFHGGGKRVGNTKDNLIIRYDGEYTGTLKGINLPIYFENRIVGVVGITGEKEEVEKYGEIIKRMTELIIKDAYLTNLKNKDIENQRMIIEELLVYEDEHRGGFLNRLKVFNIKEDVPRVVIVSEIIGEDQTILERKEEIWDIFEYKIIDKTENLMMWNRKSIIMVLQNLPLSKIKLLLLDIVQELSEKFDFKVKFGIGTIENKTQHIKASYEKARLALSFSHSLEKLDIIFYDEMDIELLVENIEKTIAIEFREKVLGNLKREEIKEFAKIISLFEKYNGSINRVSEGMFIHKNTLQYKLNKLREKTGYDMRKYRDFTSLKMAFLLNDSLLRKS